MVLHPEIIAWGTCYWGGGVPLAGGALVLGGAARFVQSGRRPRREGALWGVGAGLLALSRPFEGLVLTCLILPCLWWFLRAKPLGGDGAATRQAAFAGLLPLGLSGAFLLVYNHAVSGSAWTLPYAVYTKTFESYPPFRWWPPLSMPVYHSPAMGVFYRHWAHKFDEARASPWETYPHFAGLAWQAVFSLGWRGGLLGILLLVGVFVAVLGMKRLGIVLRGGLLLIFAFFGVLTGHFWILPHYAAPIVPATLAASLAGLRFLGAKHKRNGKRTGSLLVGFVLPALSFLSFAGYVSKQPAPGTPEFQSSYRWNYARVVLQEKLASQGGKHLVFVQYYSRHIPDEEWVFNSADFAQAPVLWAHFLDQEQNAAAQKAYPDRKAWLVVVASDWETPQIVPYPEGVVPSSSSDSSNAK